MKFWGQKPLTFLLNLMDLVFQVNKGNSCYSILQTLQVPDTI